ncbi:hypothetical protein [Streptomyces chartreusis]|uniref:hypothetical protein n=1 Tax=Streptomyces chartreusis TaxID=1969 RepID=UPI0037F6255E
MHGGGAAERVPGVRQRVADAHDLETATGTVKRTLTLDGGSQLGVDPAHDAAWSAGAAGGPLRRVDTKTFTVTASAELPAASVGFVETDPATGNVWVGSGTSVLVYDKDAKPLTTLSGPDGTTDVAFDTGTGRAFVVRQDNGDTGNGGDDLSSLAVYDTRTFEEAAKPAELVGNHSQLGEAAVARGNTYLAGPGGQAVTPGGTSVHVSSPAEGKIVKLDRRMSPKVVQSPTDQSVAPGDEVTFVAAAEGAPEPTVRWQVSPDAGQTWSAIEGATGNSYAFTAKAAHDGHRYRAEFTNSVGTTRTSPVTLTVTELGTGGDGGSGTGTTGGGTCGGTASSTGGTGTTTAGGSLASTGVTVLSVAALAAALLAAGWGAYRKGPNAN